MRAISQPDGPHVKTGMKCLFYKGFIVISTSSIRTRSGIFEASLSGYRPGSCRARLPGGDQAEKINAERPATVELG
jgi:hypothetical protein